MKAIATGKPLDDSGNVGAYIFWIFSNILLLGGVGGSVAQISALNRRYVPCVYATYWKQPMIATC
jgi:hypothetical protein